MFGNHSVVGLHTVGENQIIIVQLNSDNFKAQVEPNWPTPNRAKTPRGGI